MQNKIALFSLLIIAPYCLAMDPQTINTPFTEAILKDAELELKKDVWKMKLKLKEEKLKIMRRQAKIAEAMCNTNDKCKLPIDFDSQKDLKSELNDLYKRLDEK